MVRNIASRSTASLQLARWPSSSRSCIKGICPAFRQAKWLETYAPDKSTRILPLKISCYSWRWMNAQGAVNHCAADQAQWSRRTQRHHFVSGLLAPLAAGGCSTGYMISRPGDKDTDAPFAQVARSICLTQLFKARFISAAVEVTKGICDAAFQDGRLAQKICYGSRTGLCLSVVSSLDASLDVSVAWV